MAENDQRKQSYLATRFPKHGPIFMDVNDMDARFARCYGESKSAMVPDVPGQY